MKKKYLVRCNIESVTGTQTYRVVADSEEAALELFEKGEGEFVDEEIEVGSLSDPEIEEEEC